MRTRKSKAQSDLTDFDEYSMRSLESAIEICELNGLAIDKALQSHPVTKYVRDLPFESVEGHVQHSREKYPAIRSTYSSFELRDYRKDNNGIRNSDLVDIDRKNTYWTLPAHDRTNIQNGYCGVKHSQKDHDLPLSACSTDKSHYIKAIGGHCWSLRCWNCMNSTALKMGVEAENKVLAPADIEERVTGNKIKFSHWVLSPPQEWFIDIMQNSRRFARAFDSIIDLVQACGVHGGAIIFHPWRQSNIYDRDGNMDPNLPSFLLDDRGDLREEYRELKNYWRLGPHFHIVGYGRFLDTNRFQKFMDTLNAEKHYWPSLNDAVGHSAHGGNFYLDQDMGISDDEWIIKKIHPKKDIKSMRQTIAYLLTHAGLCNYDYDADLKEAYNDLLIPVRLKGNKKEVRECSITSYKADWTTSGWNAEHLDIWSLDDWILWTRNVLSGQFNSIRYFGTANKTRILSDYKEEQVRVCPECGSPICRYMGVHDKSPQTSTYQRKSRIRVMKDDFDEVDRFIEDNRDDMRQNGKTILNVALNIPQCSTPETQGVQEFIENLTSEVRAQLNDRCLIYVPSIHGKGLDPKIVNRKEIDKALVEGKE